MFLREFKTVVFFGDNFTQYSYIKGEFSNFPQVRVFQTQIAEEIGQILSQSSNTAIILKNTRNINELMSQDILNMKKAGVRFYFLNEDSSLSRTEIENLSSLKISTLTDISNTELRSKLEMFLLNKTRMNTEKPQESSEDSNVPKNSYFTYLKKIEGKWCVYVSTHEQEREIETLFGRSWTIYCMDLLRQAESLSEMTEDPEFSKDYLCMIYPHQNPDSTKGVSVMHIKKDASFADTYQRALTFLTKI